ncbi:MAG: transcription antitermination factor NusB [Firmicutes bacterium]|nr:transcription antitermination factor NusB [Bacillota bacterium]
MSRKTARKHILNIIFQAEFDIDTAIEQISAAYDEEYRFTEEVSDDYVSDEKLVKMDDDKIKKLRTMHNADRKFILEEAKGVINNKEEIDGIIANALENWNIERLSKIDLSILRIAVYEIVFADDIPNAVAASEAVQLAQKFSEDKAPKFINGVLGNVIKKVENAG